MPFVPPLGFSQQREIVVKNKPIIVLAVFGSLILMHPAIAESRRKAVEETPFGPPLKIGVKFVFIGRAGLRRWIDSSPAVHPKEVGGHTFQTKTGKVVR